MKNEFCYVQNGGLVLNLHWGQTRAWDSQKRFVLVLSGTQGGKTSFGPHWLYREVQTCGPGDYLAIAPTYPLMNKKMLPEFLTLFKKYLQLGQYKKQEKVFEFSPTGCARTFGDKHAECKIHFGHAQDPESLESATGKAAWLDEAGQRKFKLASWEAILRRLSIYQGRVLLTTTPYDLGWLKQKLYDPWKDGTDTDIEVIGFRSIDNPVFPRAEYERARRTLPGWKFRMFYMGLFERPAGLIYNCFKDELTDGVIHKIPRFNIPGNWRRYVGLDYGGINTVAVFYAQDPRDKALYLYRTYKAGNRTAAEHAEKILEGEPGLPLAVGGAPSEGQWRREFRAGGLPVRKPTVKDVELGIDRVYGAHKQDKIFAFDDLDDYLEEKLTYSRELDDNGEPTTKIQDKNEFHHMDAERYIISFLMRPGVTNEKTPSATPVQGRGRIRTLRGQL